MELYNKINQVISLLCAEDDFLLIELLKNRANDCEQSFLKHYSVSDKEISMASTGVTKIILNAFSESNKLDFKHQKLNRIIERNECTNCPFSIDKTYSWKGENFAYKSNDATSRCNQCMKRKSIFTDELYFLQDCEKEAMNFVKESCAEAIKCKAIINKLNTKLKNYATS